jgi:hypothetical protein
MLLTMISVRGKHVADIIAAARGEINILFPMEIKHPTKDRLLTIPERWKGQLLIGRHAFEINLMEDIPRQVSGHMRAVSCPYADAVEAIEPVPFSSTPLVYVLEDADTREILHHSTIYAACQSQAEAQARKGRTTRIVQSPLTEWPDMEDSFNLMTIDIELAEGDEWLQGNEEVGRRRAWYVARLIVARTGA